MGRPDRSPQAPARSPGLTAFRRGASLVVPDLIRNPGARGHAKTGITQIPARADGDGLIARRRPIFIPMCGLSKAIVILSALTVILSEVEESASAWQ